MSKILMFSVVFFSVYFACCNHETQKQGDGRSTKDALLRFKQASEEQRQHNNNPEKLAFWRVQLTNPSFAADSVLLSKIHYNLAGVFYALNELDSIKVHMEAAWLYMEHQTDYDEEKILLYNGLGNIAHLEQKLHQENYYYNHAAQMLSADSSLDLTPKQKITVYFSAAQSSAQLRQFDHAFALNRKAMALLPSLDHSPKDSFRAYSQMASCYSNSKRDLDSLFHYIKKMEEVAAEHPDEEKRRFVYDRKASYFIRQNRLDSALLYSRKRLAMDLNDAKNNGPLAVSVRTGNLYMCQVDLAGIFVALQQNDSAKYYLDACQDFAKKYPKSIDDESLTLYGQNRVNYFFNTRNYLAAEEEQNNLLQRIRLLYETENARALGEMSALFQLQAKDKSIHSLHETVTLSQSELQRNRLWLAVSSLALLLAIALALLLYIIQRQRKLKTETEKVQLEQRLLRTQMEPHFIFNTLSTLQSFIRFQQNEKAMKYLNQFGRLLRSSLQLSRESFVKLSEEIETLENYLSLQQMRYDDAFTYQIVFDGVHDADAMFLPPMLIQPFVENAILHGINPNGKNGMIHITFEVENNSLRVTINDSGNGVSVSVQPKSHKSLSTTISKERLAILAKESGMSAGIDIRSEENKGTTVVLVIPLKSLLSKLGKG